MLIGQIRQDGKADVVLGKPLRVLPEPELFEPVRNLLHLRQRLRLSGSVRPHRPELAEKSQAR
jgi:hypothetical protein